MPNSVITGAEYSVLATKYGNLLKLLKGGAVYMYDALTYVAEMDGVEPTRDLIVAFDNVYRAQSTALNSPSQFLEVVRAVNNHILSRARDGSAAYATVADYLTDEDIRVANSVHFPQEWADMSKLAGQDVDDFVV